MCRARQLLGLILVSLTAVLILARWFRVFDVYLVTSYSMANSLLPGDMVLVVRTLPVAIAKTAGTSARRAPGRGEVWVFKSQSGTGDSKVKRVIGLPGDTVSMIANRVVLNGVQLHEPYVRPDGGSVGERELFTWQREHLLPGTAQADYRPTRSEWGPLVVPANAYFMLGDNRGASVDSRYKGFVDSGRLAGRVGWVLFSYGVIESETSPGENVVRWSRLGKTTPGYEW